MEFLPCATAWMDPEITMLSEISKSEKDKYYMVSLICGMGQFLETKRVGGRREKRRLGLKFAAKS